MSCWKLLVIKFIVYLSMQSTTFRGSCTYHCYYVHSIHVLVVYLCIWDKYFYLKGQCKCIDTSNQTQWRQPVQTFFACHYEPPVEWVNPVPIPG